MKILSRNKLRTFSSYGQGEDGGMRGQLSFVIVSMIRVVLFNTLRNRSRCLRVPHKFPHLDISLPLSLSLSLSLSLTYAKMKYHN